MGKQFEARRALAHCNIQKESTRPYADGQDRHDERNGARDESQIVELLIYAEAGMPADR